MTIDTLQHELDTAGWDDSCQDDPVRKLLGRYPGISVLRRPWGSIRVWRHMVRRTLVVDLHATAATEGSTLGLVGSYLPDGGHTTCQTLLTIHTPHDRPGPGEVVVQHDGARIRPKPTEVLRAAAKGVRLLDRYHALSRWDREGWDELHETIAKISDFMESPDRAREVLGSAGIDISGEPVDVLPIARLALQGVALR